MKRLVLLIGTIAGFSTCSGYQPEQWNVEARQRFAEKRFGVFIHWGLYSYYAQGEWYQQDLPIDTETYGRMMYGFYPSLFNAREWVRIIKGAGARYVTITSRHHDGFSLWPTKVDDGFNVAQTPFKRDVLGELAAACEDEGLQLNLYYSLMDWHRKDYPAGKTAERIFGKQTGDYASYKRFMLAQITELIDSYHPGNIWFDGEWEHAEHQDDGTWKRTLDWDFDAIYDLIHSKHVLVANNNHQPIRDKEDIQLFERDLPGEGTMFSKNQALIQDRPVEQCDVIQKNVWGYRIGEREFRTPEEICTMICRTAAKDSNMLMNVGPDASGCFPRRAVEVLAEVGKWMSAHGEAIYGTRGLGIEKGTGGAECAKTRKGSIVYEMTLRPGAYPVVVEKHQ